MIKVSVELLSAGAFLCGLQMTTFFLSMFSHGLSSVPEHLWCLLGVQLFLMKTPVRLDQDPPYRPHINFIPSVKACPQT